MIKSVKQLTELNSLNVELATEQDTHHLGELIARHIKAPATFYLHGDLGVGKTRIVRAIIQSLGFKGNVKSPTYTLVEPYQFEGFSAYHFDLYRLSDPEELDYLGIRDYFEQDSISFIEWPEKGQGWLAAADLSISLVFHGQGRKASLVASSDIGKTLIEELKQYL